MAGIGTDKNDELGVSYFKRAAEKNYQPANVKLSECYFYGRGVSKNEATALSYAREGLNNADPESLHVLGRVTYLSDAKYSFKLFMDAALSGYPPAMFDVAIGYYMGYGVIKNYEEALKWSYITQANGSMINDIFYKVNRNQIDKLESLLGPVASASIRNNARLTSDAIDSRNKAKASEYSGEKDSPKKIRTGSGVLHYSWARLG